MHPYTIFCGETVYDAATPHMADPMALATTFVARFAYQGSGTQLAQTIVVTQGSKASLFYTALIERSLGLRRGLEA
jgi:hypothetical protein